MSDKAVSVEVVQREIAPVVARAAAIVVRTPDDYKAAADFLRDVKAAQKRVVDHFAGMKAAAHAAWKAVCNRETEIAQPLAVAERTVKGLMTTWSLEQERIRQAEQARLQAEADEQARREREKLEREAAKLKTPEKREERLAAAAAVVAPVVNVAPIVPQIKGQTVRKTWKARVTDPRAAVTALMALPDWEAYIEINAGELNRLAARTKGAVLLAGVEWYEEATMAAASR